MQNWGWVRMLWIVRKNNKAKNNTPRKDKQNQRKDDKNKWKEEPVILANLNLYSHVLEGQGLLIYYLIISINEYTR